MDDQTKQIVRALVAAAPALPLRVIEILRPVVSS